MLILSPSCFAACGHHLSPRTAIVFSRSINSVPKLLHVTLVYFPHLFQHTPFFLLYISHHSILVCEFYSLLLCHTGTSVHLSVLLLPATGIPTFFFVLAGPGPLPYNTITLGDKIAHPLGRISDPVSSWGAHVTKMVADFGRFRHEGCIDASLGVYITRRFAPRAACAARYARSGRKSTSIFTRSRQKVDD